MKNTTRNFIIGAALFIGVALPITIQAKEDRKLHQPDKKEHKQSGIVGNVVELPGPWHIRIDSQDDKLVTDIQADNTGFFEVDLKPGTYILTPYFPSIDGPAVLEGVSAVVIVQKKEFTTVELFIVHGPE